MSNLIRVCTAVAICAGVANAERKIVFPPGTRVIGPYSPGVLAGDALYVSGQGARKPDGTFPATATEQLRQCLENMKAIVEAAGLTMQHVVYTQVYVQDPHAFEEVNAAWKAYFPHDGPARSMVGIVSLPDNTPVEVNAVVIRDLSQKHVIPGGVLAGGRFYISDCPGKDASGAVPTDPGAQVQAALDRMGTTLKAAHLDFRNVVFMNPYMTGKISYEAMNKVYAKHFEFGNTPARATIEMANLPGGANIEFTGVAVVDLAQRKAVRPKNMPPSPTASPCVFAGDVFYCSAKSGFIPGPNSGVYASTVETQLRQTMRNLLDGLEEAGLSFQDVAASNVYLDDLADFQKMNGVYKLFFGNGFPARTTMQQRASVERKANAKDEWPGLEQISIVAVKP